MKSLNHAILLLSLWVAGAFLPAAVMAQGRNAEEAENVSAILNSLNWVRGPQRVNVGPVATFDVPKGFLFLDAKDTRVLLEKVLQSPPGKQKYFFGPENQGWWATFEYSESGHVKDDEKIDADALIETLRKNLDESNKERARKGWPELLNLGWKQPPFYDPKTRRLEWALSFVNSSDRQEVVNYEIRLLGRAGDTSANLVVLPERLPKALPEFKRVVGGYKFVPDQQYDAFREGDKVAEYSLATLIAGDNAAAPPAESSADSGFLAEYGKLIVSVVSVVFVALAALAVLGVFLKRFSGRGKAE
ncbi:MAG: DUF2167 domain-containing protein [Zoogloeaceae bacterium]|nr:DUF2167 domain-containing protein [Zoogloeaceae bacterium]